MKIVDAGSALSLPPAVVCLGQFDGVHLGHAALIQRAKEAANASGLSLCVHTFDPAPARLLRPDAHFMELTPLEEKLRLFESLGVEIAAVSHFDDALRNLPGETFFRSVLLHRLHARRLVAGFHHVFGVRGDTDTQRLKTLCLSAGIELDVLSPITLPDGRLISSTAIRKAIQEGDSDTALAMLGHPLDSFPL